MKTGNCDLCGIWDTHLEEGLCSCCINKYSRNFGARLAVTKALTDPATTMKELKKLADIARVSIVAVCE